jgi:hypothetical protein
MDRRIVNQSTIACCVAARRAVDTRGHIRASVCATSIVGLMISAAPIAVSAQTTAVAGGNPSYIALSLPVMASVASECGFATGEAPNGSYTAQNLSAGFSFDFAFALKCNAPSRVAVVSANGGLLAPGGTLPSGYTNLAPYQVTLNIVGDAGVSTANAVCDAQTLSAGAKLPCVFRGPATGSQGLELAGISGNAPGSYLRISAPSYIGAATLLTAAAYADTLIVTVSAAL